ncbi:hypothetical protein LWC08_09015 [Desulfobaculum bizertense]|uniref:hypothetical protein n=1 Tax=Desulfobaculum bizertense TaxID=376490 RepID=UPI001F2E4E06|nr:hypothetical protein [Desulfobaculum bizertense]UIJ36879.1 hypothetical protein LWC08_09015 [Desulfobaculum bizertense]
METIDCDINELAIVTASILLGFPVEYKWCDLIKVHAGDIDFLLDKFDEYIGIEIFEKHYWSIVLWDMPIPKSCLEGSNQRRLKRYAERLKWRKFRKAWCFFKQKLKEEKQANKEIERQVGVNNGDFQKIRLPSLQTLVWVFTILFTSNCYLCGNVVLYNLGIVASDFFDISDYVACFGWRVFWPLFGLIAVHLAGVYSATVRSDNVVFHDNIRRNRSNKFLIFCLFNSFFLFVISIYWGIPCIRSLTVPAVIFAGLFSARVSVRFKNEDYASILLFCTIASFSINLLYSLSYSNSILSENGKDLNAVTSYMGHEYKLIFNSSRYSFLYDEKSNKISIVPCNKVNLMSPVRVENDSSFLNNCLELIGRSGKNVD